MVAVPTDTFQTYQAIGIREDLADIIYNIDPTETPFMTMAGRTKANQTFHEWQTDVLATNVSTNQFVEGDDAVNDAVTPTVRLGNYTEIPRKVVQISGTEESTDKAGRSNEMAYQLAKMGAEIKRDMETACTSNNASAAGGAAVARVSGALRAWIATNDLLGATGASGGFSAGIVAAAMDGTQRALTEALLKNVIRLVWVAGGKPRVILTGPFNKQTISAFTGGSTRFDIGEDKSLTAAIDIYRSDFGDLRVVPDRFSRDRDCFVLDQSMWSLAYLRPFRQMRLAKTGDTERRFIIAEYTLRSNQEAASGVVADCTTS